MRRLLPLLSTLLLVLVLWTGTAAHAAEALDCSDVTVGSAGHYEGDGDEVPSDSDTATPHHHSVCHGHCMLMPLDGDSVAFDNENGSGMAAAPYDLSGGSGPDTALRPPIA